MSLSVCLRQPKSLICALRLPSVSALEVTHSAPYGLDYYKGLSISRDYRHSLQEQPKKVREVMQGLPNYRNTFCIYYFFELFTTPFTTFTTFYYNLHVP